MSLPAALEEIVQFLTDLPETERRDVLASYADIAPRYEPEPSVDWTIQDIRHDPECLDKVGVFVRVDEDERCVYRVQLGPEVQTLTRAMAAILCKGLESSRLQEVIVLRDDFVPKVVGSHLMRLRSQTVYYVLRRMKEAARNILEGREPNNDSPDL